MELKATWRAWTPPSESMSASVGGREGLAARQRHVGT